MAMDPEVEALRRSEAAARKRRRTAKERKQDAAKAAVFAKASRPRKPAKPRKRAAKRPILSFGPDPKALLAKPRKRPAKKAKVVKERKPAKKARVARKAPRKTSKGRSSFVKRITAALATIRRRRANSSYRPHEPGRRTMHGTRCCRPCAVQRITGHERCSSAKGRWNTLGNPVCRKGAKKEKIKGYGRCKPKRNRKCKVCRVK